MHRWDAQLAAVGRPDPLPAKIAEDGVDEILWIARQMRGPEPIAFDATDTRKSVQRRRGASRSSRCRRRPRISCCCSTGASRADESRVEGDRATLDAFLVPIG